MASNSPSWSTWYWDPSRQVSYRYRFDEQEGYLYDYGYQATDARQGSVGATSSGHRRDSGFSGQLSPTASSTYLQSTWSLDGLRNALPENTNEGRGAESRQQAAGPSQQGRHIRGAETGPSAETLDPRYHKVKSASQAKFFVRGRVFQMLWTEPAGSLNPNDTRTRGSTHFSVVQYGERAFTEIRRFIVVQPKQWHSICVPIQTYSGRGVLGRFTDARHHTIAFTAGGEPKLFEGERQLIDKQPIEIKPDSSRSNAETLGPSSRINFSKCYTVEHNNKVLGVGKVSPSHMHLLEAYYKNTNFGFQCPTCQTQGIQSEIVLGQQCQSCGTSY